jgi:hypothetical protein
VIVPDFNSQTGVGTTVAVPVRVGKGVSVGFNGVDETKDLVNVWEGIEVGVAEKFIIIQPEFNIISRKNNIHLLHRFFNISPT